MRSPPSTVSATRKTAKPSTRANNAHASVVRRSPRPASGVPDLTVVASTPHAPRQRERSVTWRAATARRAAR